MQYLPPAVEEIPAYSCPLRQQSREIVHLLIAECSFSVEGYI